MRPHAHRSLAIDGPVTRRRVTLDRMDFSAGALFAGTAVSAVGCGVLIYGRRQRRAPQFVAGVLLLLCPFVGGGPWAILGVGAAVVVALSLAIRCGA